MNRLYNEYECENEQGVELGKCISILLKDIIKDYIDNGYSINDIEKVIVDEISLTLCEAKLLRRYESENIDYEGR